MKKILAKILTITALCAMTSGCQIPQAIHSSGIPFCPDKQSSIRCYGAHTNNEGHYEGQLLFQKPYGKGAVTLAGGDKYIGEFKDGMYHGIGTYTYVNGAKYAGEWKDDMNHGKGTYTTTTGELLSGIFANNEYLYKSVESASSECTEKAGKAGTEYIAKQLEKVCLEKHGATSFLKMKSNQHRQVI